MRWFKNWLRDVFSEPTQIGLPTQQERDAELLAGLKEKLARSVKLDRDSLVQQWVSAYATEIAPTYVVLKVPRDVLGIELTTTGDDPPAPVTAAPGRAMFPAQAWSVPAEGPNQPGPSRADQLYPQLVDYEWDILREAAGQPTESGEASIYGAAYNECFSFLRKAMAIGVDGKPTELGLELLRRRDAARIDVV